MAEAPKLSKEEIAALAKVGDIRAPFTGNVCQIPAKAGQEVKKGQIVIVLEAMKMQNPIESQLDGKIDQVFVKLGQAIQAGDKLLTIAPL
ncbi:MAG: acetyl-CoA carboxylase biotin carboxyl carrier protein subunit [Pseudomonadota bacterium]